MTSYQSPSVSSQRSSTSAPPKHPPPQLSPYQTSVPTTLPSMLTSANPYGPTSGQLASAAHPMNSDQAGRAADWYHQASLPQPLHPPPTQSSVLANSLPPLSSTNPWQHHHYISPSSQAAFPPSQDRYICSTCSKAFSRPSSLRIHSHSHTGKKPFKCPHEGCGKAFSVRSNMKRHERGCHARSPTSM